MRAFCCLHDSAISYLIWECAQKREATAILLKLNVCQRLDARNVSRCEKRLPGVVYLSAPVGCCLANVEIFCNTFFGDNLKLIAFVPQTVPGSKIRRRVYMKKVPECQRFLIASCAMLSPQPTVSKLQKKVFFLIKLCNDEKVSQAKSK